MYNLTQIGNSTTWVDLATIANDQLMFGWFGRLLLLTIFIVVMMAFIQTTGSFKKSLALSSFFALVIGYLFRIIDILPEKDLFLIIIILAGSLIFMKKAD